MSVPVMEVPGTRYSCKDITKYLLAPVKGVHRVQGLLLHFIRGTEKLQVLADFFNTTMTFREDSDIVVPYARYLPPSLPISLSPYLPDPL